mgnify:CR=1 FL=1
MKVLCVFGARPEAIKMAPVVLALHASETIDVEVCVTGQHREMLDQVLDFFGIVPDFDLDVMQPNQTLSDVTAALLKKLETVFAQTKPDLVMVHGDTNTTLSASLAAYYAQIPLAHVEAGLRTGDVSAPWPEEGNRRVASIFTQYHFAPTQRARMALIHEGVHTDRIYVTGNTVIDALFKARSLIEANAELSSTLQTQLDFIGNDKKIILVTGHRRENFGTGFEKICNAIVQLAQRGDVKIVYPVHLNPNVEEPVRGRLRDCPNVHLIAPLDYPAFVALMDKSHLILTDSGGIQEEAPSLGKPVLVMRDKTERPEAIEVGTVEMVGTDEARIVEKSVRLIEDTAAYNAMSTAHNPYGDGKAADRIRKVLEHASLP